MEAQTAFIILEPEQAELPVVDKAKPCRQFLALKPAVFRSLSESGANVVSSFDLYGNFAHARTAVMQQKAMVEFEAAIRADMQFSETTIQSALNIVFYYFAIACFVHNSIKGRKNYEWLEGNVVKSGAFDEAFTAITTQLLNRRFKRREVAVSKNHAALLDFYNNYLIKRLAKFTPHKAVHLIVDGNRQSSRSFAENLKKVDKKNEFITLNVRHTSKSMVVSLKHILRSVKMLNGKKDGFPALMLYSAAWQTPAAGLFEPLLNRINNPFTKKVLQIASPLLEQTIATSVGYEKPTEFWIKKLEPEVITTDAVANSMVITACKTAKEQGGNVVFFNHGAISNQTSAISSFVTVNWSSLGRAYSEFATHHVPRTQSVADLIKVLSKGKADNLYAIEGKKLERPERTDGKFRFLLAGNFTSLENHIPWVTETPEEFTEGMREIAAAISKIENAELVIRIKGGNSKSADIAYDILCRDMAKYKNVTVKNSGSFKDDLVNSDAMVSNLSTTIDEALHENIPVILQSARKRYFYLQPDVAVNNSRKAVYAVTANTNLDELLPQIISNHKTLLSDEETRPYLWMIKPVAMLEFIKQTCGIK